MKSFQRGFGSSCCTALLRTMPVFRSDQMVPHLPRPISVNLCWVLAKAAACWRWCAVRNDVLGTHVAEERALFRIANGESGEVFGLSSGFRDGIVSLIEEEVVESSGIIRPCTVILNARYEVD